MICSFKIQYWYLCLNGFLELKVCGFKIEHTCLGFALVAAVRQGIWTYENDETRMCYGMPMLDRQTCTYVKIVMWVVKSFFEKQRNL